jgi:peptidoglycan/LPS O-acetylase OafA/YrhL
VTEAGSPAPRFRFLDAMRGIAAMWVVIFHILAGHQIDLLAAVLPAPVVAFMSHGHLGVPIFFVISGFVIAHSVGLTRVTAGFLGRFIARRSLRLDPPYWVSIAFVIAMQVLALHFVAGKQAVLPSVGTVAAHLIYLQGVLGLPEINTIYWTLCLEVQFYLSYVLLLGLVQRLAGGTLRHVVLLLALTTATASLPGVLGLLPEGAHEVWFPVLWHGFLLGAFTYWSWRGLLDLRLWGGYVAIVFASGILRSDDFAIATAIAALAFQVLARRADWAAPLEARWLQFLGRISYSLYLVHNPVSGAFFNVAYRMTGRNAGTEAGWYLPALFVNVLAATAFWYVVERPSSRLSSRLFAKFRPASASQ